MALREELQSVNGALLADVFGTMAADAHDRIWEGELPVEFYSITGRYAVVEALREATFQGALGTHRTIPVASEIASGGFMAAAALGSYAAVYGAPHLETVDISRVPEAFVSFHNRLHGADGTRFDVGASSLIESYPFIDRLLDLVLQDALDTGLTNTQVGNFGEGTLNAMGALTTYAEMVK
jgi:hypothetical protein